jgi:hypothetical protein
MRKPFDGFAEGLLDATEATGSGSFREAEHRLS